MESAYILLLAVALDGLLGEPPASLHPVVWIGRAIAGLERWAPREGAGRQLAYGAATVLIIVGLATAASWAVLSLLRIWAWPVYIGASVYLLKSCLSVRGLRQAAERVKQALVENRLEVARFEMCSLVSRDTQSLDEPLLVAATVESVAENTSDSFVAPLVFYLLLGVPGTVAYRAANTLDSMLGYHGRYEYLGKVAARLDDLLNLVPARLTGLLTVAAAGLAGLQARGAWSVMLRDHALTESPNAGWSMSAAAGALAVQLEKVGHYRLGDPGAPLTPLKIDQAVLLLHRVVGLALALCLFAQVIRHVCLP